MMSQSNAEWLLSRVEQRFLRYVESWPEIWGNLTFALSVVVFILLLEMLLVGWKECSLKKIIVFSRGTRNDIFSVVIVLLQISPFIALAMSFGTVYLLLNWLKSLIGFHLHFGLTSSVAIAVIYYLFFDFCSYWIHRWHHTIPCLWALHKYHHSAPEMNVLNKFRNHPLYSTTTSIGSIPFLFLDAPIDNAFFLSMAMQIYTLLSHSNLRMNWGWVGRYLILSPAAHLVHHSKSEHHYNKNFGTILPLWDYFFNTLKYPSRAECDNIQVGLADDNGTQTPIRYVVVVYLNFLISLKAMLFRKTSGIKNT